MKRHIFILLTLLLSAVPLLAQYSPCFEAKFAEGKRLYSSGKYNQAKQYFNEAKACPDPNTAAANEWIGKCNTKIRKAEEARQKAEQERIEAERKAREEARQRELAAEKKRQEEAERKRLEKEARTRDSIASVEKRRKEDAERKRREEEARKKEQANQTSYTSNTLRKAPWEYSFGFGILGFELRGFDSGNLPVDAEYAGPGGMGAGLKLELFYSMRKFIGSRSSGCFIMPSCTASFGFLYPSEFGVKPVLDGNYLTMFCFKDYVFPSVSFGTELPGDWNMSIGGGYFMDFMYGLHAKTKISNSLNNSSGETISHDATILSHYTGGWAGILRFNEDMEAIYIDIIVGFPKAIDCEVEGYNCQIKAPVIILSLNASFGGWEEVGR